MRTYVYRCIHTHVRTCMQWGTDLTVVKTVLRLRTTSMKGIITQLAFSLCDTVMNSFTSCSIEGGPGSIKFEPLVTTWRVVLVLRHCIRLNSASVAGSLNFKARPDQILRPCSTGTARTCVVDFAYTGKSEAYSRSAGWLQSTPHILLLSYYLHVSSTLSLSFRLKLSMLITGILEPYVRRRYTAV